MAKSPQVAGGSREGSIPSFGLPRTLDPQTLGDHLDRLYRAAWALCGSREDAEDLVQETYERVLRRPRLVRRDDDVGYLYRARRHTYFNARRTASRRPRVTTSRAPATRASRRTSAAWTRTRSSPARRACSSLSRARARPAVARTASISPAT